MKKHTFTAIAFALLLPFAAVAQDAGSDTAAGLASSVTDMSKAANNEAQQDGGQPASPPGQ